MNVFLFISTVRPLVEGILWTIGTFILIFIGLRLIAYGKDEIEKQSTTKGRSIFYTTNKSYNAGFFCIYLSVVCFVLALDNFIPLSPEWERYFFERFHVVNNPEEPPAQDAHED